MVSTFLLAALLGCGADAPPPAPQPKPAQQARKAPVKAKAKTGNLGPQQAGRGKAHPPRRGVAPAGKPLPPPIGGAGAVKATLVLEVAKAESTPPAPQPAPAPEGGAPVEGEAPAPAPAPAPESTAKVESTALVKLAWGEGQSAEASLGTVDGTCTSVEPAPVGPEGRERTPMWTVSCEHEGATSELYILQIGNLLAVVRGTPTGDEAKPMAYKPVRRVRLAPGAKLERAG